MAKISTLFLSNASLSEAFVQFQGIVQICEVYSVNLLIKRHFYSRGKEVL